ncbi:hypothetical protein EIP91_001590 [Steccherinum ochraceum]|uniref:Glucosidase II subunit alpha n=1 Tax=Steccherinum ochraceum TaxID=92696 RepID=A0A4R0RDT1_9APHY|nr:hypothetical protein EIP91_001590 [Steccherinum ochraceum]
MRVLGSFLLLAAVPVTLAVKSHDFKTCSQAGFCRRGRALSARAAQHESWRSPYTVDADSLTISTDQASFIAGVKSSLYPNIKFGLEVRVHEDGVVRVKMDEVDGLRKRYDEAASWALIADPKISNNIKWKVGKKDARAVYGAKKDVEVVVSFEPLKVTTFRNGKEQVVLNGRGLLHLEHFRTKEPAVAEIPESEVPEEGLDVEDAQKVLKAAKPTAWFEGEEEDAYWEETFSSWTDSKPKGPESLSLDITFPNHGHVYGIPQHASSLDLRTTTGESPYYTEPYRLYNADTFEYLADSTMSLYGSIPVMHAHSTDSTVAIFNAVGSETWIDIAHPSASSTETHWISESGILDVFIMPGPTPKDIFAQYSGLTGTQALPADWALGYHQCRWNYVSSDDVRSVQQKFDEADMPVDVFWLDIEYAEEHKYFIWDKKTFPDPVEMTNDVAAASRKMVVIIDPHFKRTSSYPVYQEAVDRGLLVRQKDGTSEYEGWCWSGSSAWVDFFNPAAWDWWKTLFKTYSLGDDKFSWTQSTDDVYIWNDMNEPSIFNGPEISMPRDNVHHGGWEHRDLHNINGMLFSNLTSQAITVRSDPPKRPFVLTRSFYAGSQRFGAMWTGDNLGTWEHMAVGIKMVLANSIGGFAFTGSDVGGFFGNPDPEMLVRWYHVGAFSPFFRAHAHIDTKRREPYLLAEPHKTMVKNILRRRYSMLPIWYTAFREASTTGLPVARPHYVAFPKDEAGFSLDDQYFIGSSGLLVKPVTEKGATKASVYLPPNEIFYDYDSYSLYRTAAQGKSVEVAAELSQLPLFIQGGSILSTRERPRRSASVMRRDPFTLQVALDKSSSARGELYLDDGVTFNHEQGQIVWREFRSEKSGKGIKLSSRDLTTQNLNSAVDSVALTTYDAANAYAQSLASVRVERVVVLGLGAKPTKITTSTGKELQWEYVPGISSSEKKEGTASLLVIKDPAVSIASDWEIVVQA